jgi:type II secretory pathway component PulJ
MTFVCQRAPVRRGIVLLDLLVYISVLGLVLVLAAVVFDRALTQTAGLRRNISDIERTLKAGERWRADVRAATGSIRVNEVNGQQVMVIPRADGEITYRVAPREVLRGNEVALAGVKGARLI